MKLKTGDKVKVIQCIDKSNPIEKQFMNKTGEIILMNEPNNPDIRVKFDGGLVEAFWLEELEKIK
jgi:hypothetical protein